MKSKVVFLPAVEKHLVKERGKMAESSLIMKFLVESGYYDDKTMLNRCIEIKRILIASINTAKGNK